MLQTIALLLFYLLVGATLVRFLVPRKGLDLLTGLTLMLSLGIIFHLFLTEMQHHLFTFLSFVSNGPSISLKISFVLTLAGLLMVLPILAAKHLTVVPSRIIHVSRKSLIHNVLILLAAIALAIHLVNFTNLSNGPHTDTAQFLEQARSLESHGRIESNVLHQVMKHYYSIMPHHIYVSIFYANLMSFVGISYESAKIANLIIAFLAIFASVSLSQLYSRSLAGPLTMLLIFSVPTLHTFFAFPMNGSEIFAAFGFLILLILFEVLNLKTLNQSTNVFTYFILAMVAHSIHRARVDYFSIFLPIMAALYFISPIETRRGKITTFFTVITLFVVHITFWRIAAFQTTLFATAAFGISLLIFSLIFRKKAGVGISWFFAFLFLLSLPSFINLHISGAAESSLTSLYAGNIVTNVTMLQFYSQSELFSRLQIFLNYLVTPFPISLWIFSVLSIVLAFYRRSRIPKVQFSLLPLLISVYCVFIAASTIDNPKGFDKHRFFVLPYMLILIVMASSIANNLSNVRLFVKKSTIRVPINLRSFTLILSLVILMSPIITYDAVKISSGLDQPSAIVEKNYVVAHLEKAYEWLQNTTSRDIIIFARKPFEAAWYTERRAIHLTNPPNDHKHFYQLLVQYNISYVIVDYPLLDTYNKNNVIQELYRGKHSSPLELVLSYKYGPHNVLLYKVNKNATSITAAT